MARELMISTGQLSERVKFSQVWMPGRSLLLGEDDGMAVFEQAFYQRSFPRRPSMVFGTDHQNRIGMQHRLKGFQNVPAEIEVYLHKHCSLVRNGPETFGKEIDVDRGMFERQWIKDNLDVNQTDATIEVRRESNSSFQGAERFRW